MQKKFIVNLAFLLLLNILVKPFYILGIDAEILKQVEASNPGMYGEYFSLIGLTFIFNIFLDFGIINFNTRNIAQNDQLLTKHFSGIISVRAFLSLFYIVLIVISGWLLGYSKHQFEILMVLAFNQILVAFILYFRSNLSGLLLFKQDSIISVLDRILLIGTCSILLWGGMLHSPFKIEWFVYAQTASYGITAIVSGVLVIRKTGWFKPKFDKAFSILILKKSMPYALLVLLMMIYYRSDSVMLERMMPKGARESALYAQGFRFFEAFNMIGFLFAGLLLPIFSRMIKEKENISSILFLAFKILFSVSIVVGIAGYLYSEELISWRYQISGIELERSAAAFGMLMLSFISICVTYIFGTLLTAHGSLKKLNWLAFFGVGLNIGLNLWLIPDYGAYGAALASLITQMLTAIGQVILSFQEVELSIDTKSIYQIGIFITSIILLVVVRDYISLPWGYSALLFVVFGAVFSIVTGMVSLKGIVRILKTKQ